ncbi:hypothetical protein CYLTODRAFT_357437, partial [Cylindrobasidium torrendii FP15055 ss-10]
MRPSIEGDSLIDVVAGGRAGTDLREAIRYQYSMDPVFSTIIEKPKEYKNFEYKDGLLYVIIHQDVKLLCIPDVIHEKRRIREIILDEAHSLLAHLGARKTMSYLRAHVWWKT